MANSQTAGAEVYTSQVCKHSNSNIPTNRSSPGTQTLINSRKHLPDKQIK